MQRELRGISWINTVDAGGGKRCDEATAAGGRRRVARRAATWRPAGTTTATGPCRCSRGPPQCPSFNPSPAALRSATNKHSLITYDAGRALSTGKTSSLQMSCIVPHRIASQRARQVATLHPTTIQPPSNRHPANSPSCFLSPRASVCVSRACGSPGPRSTPSRFPLSCRASMEQPLCPSRHRVPPPPATTEANLCSRCASAFVHACMRGPPSHKASRRLFITVEPY